jgi:hypothetical protein
MEHETGCTLRMKAGSEVSMELRNRQQIIKS